MKKIFIALTLLLTLTVSAQKRCFRGAWIASVAQIDFPIKGDYDTESQKASMIRMLDSLANLKFNAIIFQIRPCADALYQSSLEPWSKYLTGKQGVAPNTMYDPLSFVIEEAHKRNIDVHAWLNPYRVTMGKDSLDVLSEDNYYFKRPDLYVKYGTQYYFDPGLTETREFLNKVVVDILNRYDVDAIHMDDYFYPYPLAGQDFPDSTSFAKEPRGFTIEQKEDWRRNNVDLIIQELCETIKSVKPYVDFGISPFGVWRNSDKDPRGSASKAGCTNYDHLYADIYKWLEEGWIDYIAPQLYWEIGKEIVDYPMLLKWWADNKFGRNLYIGQYASKLGSQKEDHKAWREGNEIVRQIIVNRSNADVDGEIMFSARPMLNENKYGLLDSLANNYYKNHALIPVSAKATDLTIPSTPTNVVVAKDKKNKTKNLKWDSVLDNNGGISNYVVYCFEGKEVGDYSDPKNIYKISANNEVVLDNLKGRYTFVVTAINRYKQESPISKAITKKL